MPQTFYIENDEEIISVIGRLRKSSSEENFFVFPKRALVLQSIVNLRLFQREAEKIGKKIIIVTQDDAGKVLAEKAGLMTERYTDDFSRQAEQHIEIPAVSAPKKSAPLETPLHIDAEHSSLRAKDIGSNDFYTSPRMEPSMVVAPTPPVAVKDAQPRTLRIRNASPEKQTSLNSKRVLGSDGPSRMMPRPIAPLQGTDSFAPVINMGIPSGITPQPQPLSPSSLQTGREERLRNFFSNGGVTPAPEAAPFKEAPRVAQSMPATAISSRKAGGIFLFLGGVSVVSLLGVGVFLFLPKAEVHIVPYRTTQNVDLQFEGTMTGEDSDRVVAVRFVEKEQAVSITTEATGTSLGSAQKARGTVTITNAFSADAQSLVATTRLETPEGKIFRLQSGVTVPGMKDGQPGSVDTTVIADQPGTEYNITPATFTIPGFKGSPKYEKFSARSVKAMAGGSASNGTNQTVISKSDLEKAALEGQKEARQSYIDGVKAELLPGERILEENIDMVSLQDATLPLSGTAASSFEYKNTYRIRGFVFSEEALKQRILSNGEERVGTVLFRPVAVSLSYGEAIPDFDARTVRLKTHAVVTSESVIEREKFLAGILGKDEKGIDEVLTSFPEIKKIEIDFKPRFFSSSIPNSESRVTLFVEPGQE